jgi:hypothetical protein
MSNTKHTLTVLGDITKASSYESQDGFCPFINVLIIIYVIPLVSMPVVVEASLFPFIVNDFYSFVGVLVSLQWCLYLSIFGFLLV